MPILLDRTPLADTDAARTIASLLAGTAPIARRDLNAAMTEAMAASDADGAWTQRDSFEMLENALALHLATRPYPLSHLEDVAHASALMDRLPTQTVRSETQVELQQLSTPVDIGALAVLMAAIVPEDIVLEPSAGNGLLVVQALRCASLQLHELDAARRARLATVFPHATITGHDGAGLVSTHAALPRPTVVLMNPPFARSVGRGADDLAALRHLQAAIRRVAKGGRVVTLMPDWFAPSARMRAAYEAVLTGCSVRVSLRLEHCYRKDGTDVAVRLYVIDKTPGGIMASTIQRGAVAEFLDVVALPARAPLVGETTTSVAAPARGPSLFGAARTTKVLAPRPYHAPARNDVLPVGYQPLAQPAPLAEQVGVYLPYRPSRILFDAAGEHPTDLVESVAMGSIPAPIPTHSRLQQIIDWAGPDFDGVIAFDEAHEMGGVAGGEGAIGAKEGSQQGICGVLLQNNLPDARVLYASATGASDVNNLAYAVRLGLWGPETAFSGRERSSRKSARAASRRWSWSRGT